MLKTCVIVADRSRARLFVTQAPPARSLGSDSLELRELEALVQPEGEPGSPDVHDDHRERHREEVQRRFAKRVASSLRGFLEREGASRVVLAVEPRMLGLLRQALDQTVLPATQRLEISADLSWHTPRHILDVLRRHGALPA